MPAVVIVEADESTRLRLEETLRGRGYEVLGALDTPGALRRLHDGRPAVLILGSSGDGPWEALRLAQEIRGRDRFLPLILVASQSSEELAIAALRAGVTDYLRSPVSSGELLASVSRCLAPPTGRSPAGPPQTVLPPVAMVSRLIGDSRSMREVNAYIRQVASTDTTVLITGETGTGKELAAELIHAQGHRAGKPFVPINCAAIPESLLESELFGHERGAFTGAHAQKEGALRLANEGTAFFDEIGDMSPEGQAKILRAIESREIRRLGGKGSIPLNLRVIAATNQDLEQRVAEGKFRKDLYFRLNVARISLPPLRDRKEDIPPLLGHYIGELNRRLGREVEGLTEDAMESLLRYEWPGNVRELKNLLEAIYVILRSRRIALTDLPEQFRRHLRGAEGPQTERDLLLSALLSTRWNKSQAAERLRWSRMTLYRKMAKYRIVRGDGGSHHGGTSRGEV